jgi:hypothetical protein
MSLYTQFQTDSNLEKTGILLEYGETEDGKPICIRIARAGGANKSFEKRMELETKPIRRQLQNETVNNAQLLKLLRKVYAETVVLGWENVQDPDGKDIPFTVENCIKLFEDLPDLFTDLQEQSRRAALFRQQAREADGKN